MAGCFCCGAAAFSVNVLERTLPDGWQNETPAGEVRTGGGGEWKARVLNDTGHLPQRLFKDSLGSGDRSSLATSASHNSDGS